MKRHRPFDWGCHRLRRFVWRWKWLCVLLALLTLPFVVWSQEKPLEPYKPLGGMVFCQDVQLPCIPMFLKDTAIYFAVLSKEGKLIAVTKMLDGKEEVVWGKLPLKANEKEL